MPDERKAVSPRRRVLCWIGTETVLLVSAFLAAISLYKAEVFETTQFYELLFYAQNGLDSMRAEGLTDAVTAIAGKTGLAFALVNIPIVAVLAWRKLRRTFGKSRRPGLIRWGYTWAIFVVAAGVGLQTFGVPSYLWSLWDTGTVYEDSYVDPATAHITAPAKPRNLIFIYLESMENTLASRAAGGQSDESLIPELEALALDPANVSFSHTATGLGGPRQVDGTSWSLAGMVATTGGIPLKPSVGNDGRSLPMFLPGAHMLGDVLRANGYDQSIVMGSYPAFGGVDKLVGLHGAYTMLDPGAMKAAGRIPADYRVWWGYEDRKLFGYAQDEARRLAAGSAPFQLQIITEDTHWPDGYSDPQCRRTHPRQYDDVYACSSAQVGAFVSWVRQQPWADNTTIVLVGDHIGHQTRYYTDKVTSRDFVRTPYNVIINPAVRPERSHGRTFTSMDFYPTILTAMGFTVPGHRLGLGTDLNSSVQTLPESMGFREFDKELAKRSAFYDHDLMDGPAPR